jgi:hypothetical protein
MTTRKVATLAGIAAAAATVLGAALPPAWHLVQASISQNVIQQARDEFDERLGRDEEQQRYHAVELGEIKTLADDQAHRLDRLEDKVDWLVGYMDAGGRRDRLPPRPEPRRDP